MMLTACDQMRLPDATGPRPDSRPAMEAAEEASPLDPALVDSFAATEASLVTRGLLRTDSGGTVDDPERLARTFLRIALFDEYSEIGGAIDEAVQMLPGTRHHGQQEGETFGHDWIKRSMTFD